MQINHISD